MPHAKKVHDQYKTNETNAIVKLIQEHQIAAQTAKPYDITDVGGSNGAYLLKALEKNHTQARINVIEPDHKQYQTYLTNIDASRNITAGHLTNQNIQNINAMPCSDTLLCSHSLYYTKHLWHHNQHAALLRKMIHALKPNGQWIVALQSNNPQHRIGKTALLEEVENISYPARAPLQGMSCPYNHKRNTYANATMFQQSINALQRNHPHIKLDTSTTVVASKVETRGHMDAYLAFYSGGLFNQFNPSQKEALTKAIGHGVTHATEVISIRIKT